MGLPKSAPSWPDSQVAIAMYSDVAIILRFICEALMMAQYTLGTEHPLGTLLPPHAATLGADEQNGDRDIVGLLKKAGAR
jgi:hypothetical protein